MGFGVWGLGFRDARHPRILKPKPYKPLQAFLDNPGFFQMLKSGFGNWTNKSRTENPRALMLESPESPKALHIPEPAPPPPPPPPNRVEGVGLGG